jgi:hypothetical protein
VFAPGSIVAGEDAFIESKIGINEEGRINIDQGSSVFDSLRNPMQRPGMIPSCIGAHNQDDITVLDVNPVVRHRSSTKRLRQSCNNSGVSYAHLVFDVYLAHRPQRLHQHIAFLIVEGTAAREGDGRSATHQFSVPIGLDPVSVTGLLDTFGIPIQCPISLYLLFLVTTDIGRRPSNAIHHSNLVHATPSMRCVSMGEYPALPWGITLLYDQHHKSTDWRNPNVQ